MKKTILLGLFALVFTFSSSLAQNPTGPNCYVGKAFTCDSNKICVGIDGLVTYVSMIVHVSDPSGSFTTTQNIPNGDQYTCVAVPAAGNYEIWLEGLYTPGGTCSTATETLPASVGYRIHTPTITISSSTGLISVTPQTYDINFLQAQYLKVLIDGVVSPNLLTASNPPGFPYPLPYSQTKSPGLHTVCLAGEAYIDDPQINLNPVVSGITCTDTLCQTVVVLDTTPVQVSDLTPCPGQAVTLTQTKFNSSWGNPADYGVTFQWYGPNSLVPIAGATGVSLTVTQGGTYLCIITTPNSVTNSSFTVTYPADPNLTLGVKEMSGNPLTQVGTSLAPGPGGCFGYCAASTSLYIQASPSLPQSGTLSFYRRSYNSQGVPSAWALFQTLGLGTTQGIAKNQSVSAPISGNRWEFYAVYTDINGCVFYTDTVCIRPQPNPTPTLVYAATGCSNVPFSISVLDTAFGPLTINVNVNGSPVSTTVTSTQLSAYSPPRFRWTGTASLPLTIGTNSGTVTTSISGRPECEVTSSFTYTVKSAPTVAFTNCPTGPIGVLAFTLSVSGVMPSGGVIKWEFDNNTVQTNNVVASFTSSYTFPSNLTFGTHIMRVTVVDSNGCSETKTCQMEVVPNPPFIPRLVGKVGNAAQPLTLFPNPTTTLGATLQGEIMGYTLTDAAGRVVESRNGASSATTIGADLAPGLYLLTAQRPDKQTETLRLVIGQ